jgi:hypothetical protein
MSAHRRTLDELRRVVLAHLDDEQWTTASDMRARLGLGGSDWYRLCLTLERLVLDGEAELDTTGNGRRYRRLDEGGGATS